MKSTLKPGLAHRFAYKVPENKTVPYTYPEAPEIASMPKVFATGNMIILMEWTCAQLLARISIRARAASGCMSMSAILRRRRLA